MKNLKKVAALVIVLAMALSSVAFAAYTDVAEDAGYYEAVEVMSALGLLKGYEDGTFGPDKTITRAEFAAVIVRALGMEDAAAGAVANTIFTDVTSAHWAAGYIQIANQQGIIAGYGDGTFGPDDEVTYEQAVKMIVCSLGYNVKFAGVENAYPSGYLSQANTSGITVGATGKIGEKATRAVVAKLVYNALDTKLMEQIEFGTDNVYAEVDKTLLSYNLNVIKVEATVGALHFDPELTDKVTIDVTKISDIYADAADLLYVSGSGYNYSTLDRDYVYAETINPAAIKGYSCVAYIDISGDEDDWNLVAMVPKAGRNSTLVLTATQTESASFNLSTHEATYYKNSVDTDINETKIKLSAQNATTGTSEVTVYVNKNADALSANALTNFATAWGNETYAQFTLIDNNGDSKYDVIYATDYTAGIVDEIAPRSYKLTFVNGGSLKLNPDDDNYIYNIVDADGKAMDFADIKTGDVVNYMTSVDGNYKYYDVVVTTDRVEGSISEVVATKGVTVGGNTTYYASEVKIGDTNYLVEDYDGLDLKSGNSGVFVLDMLGKILDFEVSGGNTNFGYIYGSYADTTGLDAELKTIIYTTAGEFVTYSYAKNVYINTSAQSTASSTLTGAIPTALTTKQLVMYETNSSNQITKVYTGSGIASNSKYTANTASAANYKASTDVIDGDFITDDTIFIANSKSVAEMKAQNFVDEKGNYAISSKAMFNEDDTYEIATIVDRDDNIVIALVYNAKAKVENDSAVMYVTNVGSSVDSEGDDAKTVTGYVDGELVTIVVTNDTNVYSRKYFTGNYDNMGNAVYADAYNNVTASNITKGSMIQFAGEGEVAAVRILVTGAEVIAQSVNNMGVPGRDDEDDVEGFVYAGSVYEIVRNKNIVFDSGAEIDFSAAVEAAIVKLNNGAIRNVFASGYAFNDVETTKDAYGTNASNDDILVVYKFDGDAVGAIIVDGAGDFE